MAHSNTARKRVRQMERRTAVNRTRVSRIRTYIKKVEAAIAEGNVDAAKEAFRAAQPVMQAGINKGVVHKNTIARKLSRLNASIKAMA